MDHDRFRDTYREMNERACRFEKSVLAGHCRCAEAERFNLAEREGVHCKSDLGHDQCEELVIQLRQQSRFTLKLNSGDEVLPHNKAMRLQVGGMRGLYLVVTGETDLPPQIENINGLIAEAIANFGSLDQLPYQEIIKQISAYKGRGRRSDR